LDDDVTVMPDAVVSEKRGFQKSSSWLEAILDVGELC
jgi:hypothetical protein